MSSEVVTVDTPREQGWNAARRVTYGVAAFLSLLGAIRYGIHAETFVVVFVIAVLVVISRHDLERHIIPNRLVVPAWIVVLLAQLAIYPHRWLEWTLGSLGAGLFFLVVLLAYPAGLGMGDVKLALLLGAALGWAVVAALLIGTLAAGVVSLGLLIAYGSSARKRAIPFGTVPRGGRDRSLCLIPLGVQLVNKRWAFRPIVFCVLRTTLCRGETKGGAARMTAESPPPRTAAPIGVGPKPAADAQLLAISSQRRSGSPRGTRAIASARARVGRTHVRTADPR